MEKNDQCLQSWLHKKVGQNVRQKDQEINEEVVKYMVEWNLKWRGCVGSGSCVEGVITEVE